LFLLRRFFWPWIIFFLAVWLGLIGVFVYLVSTMERANIVRSISVSTAAIASTNESKWRGAAVQAFASLIGAGIADQVERKETKTIFLSDENCLSRKLCRRLRRAPDLGSSHVFSFLCPKLIDSSMPGV
jgi:hypothetical protein